MIDIATVLLREYGAQAMIMAALACSLVFFIRRTVRREDRLQKQIDEMNREIRDTVVPILIECKDAIKQNSAVLLRMIDGRRE